MTDQQRQEAELIKLRLDLSSAERDVAFKRIELEAAESRMEVLQESIWDLEEDLGLRARPDFTPKILDLGDGSFLMSEA